MQKFTKSERLCSKILIDQLFEKGSSFKNFPFKVIWLETPEVTEPLQVVISVPKRVFKRAVDRNKVKRRIREAYRKNKILVTAQLKNKKVILMLMYTTNIILDYKAIEVKLIEGLEQLNKKINNKTD
jgi:ribonuclease P protein component